MTTALVIYCTIHCLIIDVAITAGLIKVYKYKRRVAKLSKKLSDLKKGEI